MIYIHVMSLLLTFAKRYTDLAPSTSFVLLITILITIVLSSSDHCLSDLKKKQSLHLSSENTDLFALFYQLGDSMIHLLTEHGVNDPTSIEVYKQGRVFICKRSFIIRKKTDKPHIKCGFF